MLAFGLEPAPRWQWITLGVFLVAGGLLWAAGEGKLGRLGDPVHEFVDPPDDSDDLWWMARRNFHNDEWGPAEGCPWKYLIDPEAGFSYIIEKGTRVERFKKGRGDDWPTEVKAKKPVAVSLLMGCGHNSKQLGLEFGIRITGVGHHRVYLPIGKVPFLLDHNGPLPASGFSRNGPTGALGVPGVIDDKSGRYVTMRPTQEMIRGFQGAWSMTAAIPLDDDTIVFATFDLKHSRAHSETIYQECRDR